MTLKYFKSFLGLFIGMFLLSSCDRSVQGDRTSVYIQMPSTEQIQKLTKSDITTLTLLDVQRLCFAVNVIGPGIKTQKSGACDIEKGNFGGFAGQGEQLALDVEIGADRTFELYAFLKSTAGEKCPMVIDQKWGVAMNKVYALGKSTNVNITATETNIVEIPFSLPSESQNIIVQRQWPATCAGLTPTPMPTPPSVTAKRTGRVVSGAAFQHSTVSNYRVYGKISPLNDQKPLGTNYKIHNGKVGW